MSRRRRRAARDARRRVGCEIALALGDELAGRDEVGEDRGEVGDAGALDELGGGDARWSQLARTSRTMRWSSCARGDRGDARRRGCASRFRCEHADDRTAADRRAVVRRAREPAHEEVIAGQRAERRLAIDPESARAPWCPARAARRAGPASRAPARCRDGAAPCCARAAGAPRSRGSAARRRGCASRATRSGCTSISPRARSSTATPPRLIAQRCAGGRALDGRAVDFEPAHARARGRSGSRGARRRRGPRRRARCR